MINNARLLAVGGRFSLAALAMAVCLSSAMFHAASAAEVEKIDLQPATDFLQLPEGMKLGACSAVDVNSRGEIVLFHRGKHPILIFDRQGKYLRSFGDGVVTTAHGLRIDKNDHIWATDIGSHRVFQFDSQGKLLLALGTGEPGEANDQFNKPTDIAFAEDGSVFITDGYGNSRVMKFSAKGQLVKSWGVRGKGAGEFHLPHSIVIDRDGRVLVGDRENDRIQVFNQEGELLEIWTGFAPFGLAFDPSGGLFVADGRAQKVLRLDSSGKVVQEWGRKGDGPGEFNLPHMLAFDQAGNLYLAEVGNRRLQMFRRGAAE